MLSFRGLAFFCLWSAAVPAWSQAPVVTQNGIVDAASYSARIAPGAFISIFGSGFSPGTVVAPSLPLSASLGTVFVDVIDGGRTLSAPIWFVSPGQINAQMPFGITSPAVQVQVRSAGVTSNQVTVAIAPHAPSFYTKDASGRGEAILVHVDDYSLVSQSAPAYPGENVFAYMSGLGAVTPALDAGQPGAAAAPLNAAEPVQVSVAGLPAQPSLFAGMAPGFVVYQVNFTIPANAPAGPTSQPLLVTAGAAQSQDQVFTWIGRAFRTVQASVPYLNCEATESYKSPALVFGVTCPTTVISNSKNTDRFKGSVPLVWNQGGTDFTAIGRIPGTASTDYCDISISGHTDATGQTVVSARFHETCHTEEAATTQAPALLRDTDQDYSFANLPAANPLLFRAAGTTARQYVASATFNETLKNTDGSPYMSWALFQTPPSGPSDVTQVAFIR